MQKLGYQSVQPITKELMDIFKELNYEPQDFQIQVKYAFEKKVEKEQFDAYLKKSNYNPVILESQDKHHLKKFKINAGCSPHQYKNALVNINELKHQFKIETQKYDRLYMNYYGTKRKEKQQRFIYTCQNKEWSKVDKQYLLKKQIDLIIKQKLFRMDVSWTIFVEKEEDAFKQVTQLMEKQKIVFGFLSFKRSQTFSINKLFKVILSQVYEKQGKEAGGQKEFLQIRQIILKRPEKIEEIVHQILDDKILFKNEIRHELEVLILPSGVEYMIEKNDQNKRQEVNSFISQVLDFTEKLTCENHLQLQEVLKMMKKMKQQ